MPREAEGSERSRVSNSSGPLSKDYGQLIKPKMRGTDKFRHGENPGQPFIGQREPSNNYKRGLGAALHPRERPS